MIYVKKIKSIDIPFLLNKNCLYISDFRAIGESMDYDIPAMWKYENLLPWILNNQNVVVNEDASDLKYVNKNNLIIISKGEDSRISFFEKIEKQILTSNNIKNIWVAIPHPQADIIAEKYNLDLNYTYKDFIKYNDKYSQKELFKKFSPDYFIIESEQQIKDLFNQKRNGYLKRRFGSGGYTVFKTDNPLSEELLALLKVPSNQWYYEDYVSGDCFSIQCYKTSKSAKIYLFGYTKQKISEGKYYCGAEILPLDLISENLISQLNNIIDSLADFLNDYEGFFGLDYIQDNSGKIHALETNIRMTSATVPSLLNNNFNANGSEYLEDVSITRTSKHDITLCTNNSDKNKDILKIKKR